MVSYSPDLTQICVSLDKVILPSMKRNCRIPKNSNACKELDNISKLIENLEFTKIHFDMLPADPNHFNLEAGFLKFLRGIFDCMIDRNSIKEQELLESFKNIISFEECLMFVMSLHPAYSLYFLECLFGLTQFQIFNRFQFLYVFLTNHKAQNRLIKELKHEPDFKDQIRMIMLQNIIIEESFKEFVPPSLIYANEVIKFTENIYFFTLPEKHYGKTLSNLSIAISSFQSLSNINLRKGAQLIVILHEFAHYCQRACFSNIGEVLSYSTPENSKAGKEVESGYEIEKYLFNKKISKLSIEGAVFLLNGNYSIVKEDFTNQFWRHNVIIKNQEYANLSRSGDLSEEYAELGSCGMRSNKYISEIFKKINLRQEQKFRNISK